ncbi:MAG: hypothetical protein HYT76_08565 [Deltaproteobacteria bacterium]|nr:hypothetical protein [Deltaproteobacteria bacterium]
MLTFAPARPITLQEYKKVIGADGGAPLPGKILSTGMLESGIDLFGDGAVEDHATFHIVEDLDRDGRAEDFYFRVNIESPAPFRATFSFHATTRCRGDDCHRNWELWEREPFSVSTREGTSLAILKGVFLADVTGDGIRDIVVLTDDTGSTRTLQSLFQGATILEGKKTD